MENQKSLLNHASESLGSFSGPEQTLVVTDYDGEKHSHTGHLEIDLKGDWLVVRKWLLGIFDVTGFDTKSGMLISSSVQKRTLISSTGYLNPLGYKWFFEQNQTGNVKVK